MSLVGSSQNISASAEDRLPGHSNYLMGSDPAKWLRNLETYRKVLYTGVYPGVDLLYYGTQGRLEYDFILAPQADPSKIRLKFAGAQPVVDASGDLVLSLPKNGQNPVENDVRFRKPVLYQQVQGVRQPVSGKFTIAANHEVSFEVGTYDRAQELVIDPVLVYSSYLGGSSQQSVINGMTTNAAGDIYVTGVTNAVDYPTTAGVIQPTCPTAMPGQTKCGPSSLSAAFVSKIGADGQSLIYSTYLGGSGSGYGVGGSGVSQGGNGADYGTSIAVDANDNAWVLGGTNSNNFPITADAIQLYCSPTSAGYCLYGSGCSGYYGEISTCAGYNGGGEYIYGPTSLFIVKLDPAGANILYGTFLGGSWGEVPAAIALDATGNVYVAGTVQPGFNSNLPPAQVGFYNYPVTPSAYQTTSPSQGWSAFVTELSPDGHSLVYSTYYAAPVGQVLCNTLAVNAGKIFIGGSTWDPALPTTTGALSTTCPVNPPGTGTLCVNNGYVAEFDPTQSGAASLVFSTYLNGSASGTAAAAYDTSIVSALAADAAGNVYVGGSTQYTDFPTTPGVLQPACNASGDDICGTGFVTKLGPAGALVWSTYYGSPSGSSLWGSSAVLSAIAVDANSDVYISGNSNFASDLPTKNGVVNYAGPGQAYVAELSSDASQVLFGSYYGGNGNMYPTGIAVDASGSIYLAGYTADADLPLVNAFQKTDGGGFYEGFFAKISLTAGQPTQMNASTGTPQSAAVSTAFGTLLSVTVTDASNNPVQGVVVTFTAPSSGAGGTFANSTNTTQATTNASGVATATTFTANTQAGGPYNVAATATGLPTVNFALTNTAGAATQMTANAGATPQSAQVTQAFGTLLGVIVLDANNNPVQGALVTFTAPGSGASGTFANGTATTQATTNASGAATATIFTANTHAGGPYNVAATATRLTSVNFVLTNSAGPATQMTANAGATPQSAQVTHAFVTLLGVTVLDANNNPVQGALVTFTAPGSGASGTFSNSTATTQATTNASGAATATIFTANTHAGGLYNVAATAAGLTTVNFVLTNTAGAATQMTANTGTTPQSAQVSTAFGTLLAVTVLDTYGDPIQGVPVTFTAPTGTGIATGAFAGPLSSVQATTGANGVATATAFTANTKTGGYTVTASASNLTTVNFSLTNTAGAAAGVSIAAGNNQSAIVNTAFATNLQVQVTDQYGNAVPSPSVTFTAPASGSSGAFQASTTNTTTVTGNTSGGATASAFTANGTAGGPYHVSVTSGTGSNNFSLTNLPAAVHVTIGTSPGGLSFSVDSVTYTSAQTMTWTVGSQHTIATSTPQTATGTKYIWQNWSDGGLISHSVTAPGTNTTYTANFQTQYLLTTLANPVAGGTVSGAGYYVAGATAAVTATPASQYAFSSFTGTTSAPTVNPGSVVMNAPTTVTANFVIPAIPTTTVLKIAGATDYSDAVKLQATVSPLVVGSAKLAGAVQFAVNGVNVGSPVPLSGGVASTTYTIALGQGPYPVTAQFLSSNTSFANSQGNATLTVSREQAVVTLAAGNPTVVQVKNPTSTAGPLTFNATIRQANEGDAPGNISLAVPVTCTLTPVFPPQQVLQATATVSGGGVGGTLNASCTFAAVPVNLYEVAIGIGGNYYTGTGIGLLLVY